MSPRLLCWSIFFILASCAVPEISARPEDVTTTDISTSDLEAATQISTQIVNDEDGDESDVTTEIPENNNLGGDIRFVRLDINGKVRHRYATMKVHGEMKNYGNAPEEATFTIHLPDTAFVSKATLFVDGKRLNGEVKEKKAAEQEYQQAVNAGQSAGHVSSVRDSSNVQVSVNVAPRASASFNITYEELLVRRKGRYEIVLNLSPDQPPEYMNVDVRIKESSNITFVKVPPFDSSLAADGLDDNRDNTAVSVKWPDEEDNNSALVSYESKGSETALPGPLIIRYDVDHSASSGEVLLMDGYFVHFLAASQEREAGPALPKHAIFVLDSSGSMWGRKLQQLKDAMSQILGQLQRHDVFSIVTFSTSAAEWSIQEGLEPAAGRGVYAASRRNIGHAQDYINRMEASGATNIQSALRRAIGLAARYRNITLAPGVSEGANYTPSAEDEKRIVAQPVIMFLTDGMPTAGELRLNRILTVVKFSNQAVKASIFALAFGDGANLSFLRKLSLQNSGFSRRIYEAADSALQLQSFYQEVASPLLTNVTFTYIDSKVNSSSITTRVFPTLFSGSEAVVAGQLKSNGTEWNEIPAPSFTIMGYVSAQSTAQVLEDVYMPSAFVEKAKSDKDKNKRRKGHLERAWAFLSIKQLLDAAALEQTSEEAVQSGNKNATKPNEQGPRAKALAIALQYGFVTPVTSLVLVERDPATGVPKEAPVKITGTKDDFNSLDSMNAQDKVMPSINPLLSSVGRPAPIRPMPIGTIPRPAESTSKSWVDSLPWLADRIQNDDVLSFKNNDTEINRIVLRSPENKSPDEALPCSLNTTDMGLCRHLALCYDDITSYEIFIEKFCDIAGKYVGVCCLPA